MYNTVGLLIFGLFTLAAIIYILNIRPDFLVRFILWMLAHTVYKIRIAGQENVSFRGPALLVCNHISFIDALLVGASVQRFIRFVVFKSYYDMPALNWLFRLMKAIPVTGEDRKDVFQFIERAREELHQGHVVCIFAEGVITRTGNILPFKKGFEQIIDGLNVPVIPVHLDCLWGSIFSFKNGRFFWKWPAQFPHPVTVSFGRTLPSTTTAPEVRQAIAELGSITIDCRRNQRDLLHLRFIKTAKRRWFSLAMADSTGKKLTYGKVLTASLLLSGWIKKRFPEDRMIGVMLPSSVAGVLVNIGLLLAGKIPVNLNFTAGQEAIASALHQCGTRTILTSRLFLTKAKLEEMEGMVFLEEVIKQITLFQKIRAALKALLIPARLLQALHQRGQKPEDLATVIFSSGSTGIPKGVMLSHHNILSNIEAFAQIFWVDKTDRVMGVLPFFHSFGFTGTLWFPLVAGVSVVYHTSPLDAKTIGGMVFKYQATILISTPTFYAAYLRKCSEEEFSSLRLAVVGAEKLHDPLAKAFKVKYGQDLLEGYGCTEMAPVVAVNIHDVEHGDVHQIGYKAGTVGHPIPGVVAKVVDRDTGKPLPYGRDGLLLVRGPSCMLGYLGEPEKTAEVLRDGWYVTGDIASMDEDGFIQIKDRLSRFSKIGGEMVPHLKVEEALHQVLGDQDCVVTAIPDEQKGECLIVFYINRKITSVNLRDRLCETDLPKLWIPKEENFYCIDTIPTLGTGKIDLRKIKTMAIEISEKQD